MSAVPELTQAETRCIALHDELLEKVYPVLHQLDDKYPGEDSYLSLFICLIYALYGAGWTKEELFSEVAWHIDNADANGFAAKAQAGGVQ